MSAQWPKFSFAGKCTIVVTDPGLVQPGFEQPDLTLKINKMQLTREDHILFITFMNLVFGSKSLREKK